MKTLKHKNKTGQGRTKGSFSFVTMKVKDVLTKLTPEGDMIVSRKWAESHGFGGMPTGKIADLNNSLVAPEAKVNVVEL